MLLHNEPVVFSHCVHLKLGHRFHALLKVCSDRDDIAPFKLDSAYSTGHKLFQKHAGRTRNVPCLARASNGGPT